MGMPSASIVQVKRFLICRFRRLSTAASSDGPSTPQFQLRLSFAPSRLYFAVRLVVLQIIGDEVVECESVVGRYEVYAHLGLPFLVPVDLGTAEQPVCH